MDFFNVSSLIVSSIMSGVFGLSLVAILKHVVIPDFKLRKTVSPLMVSRLLLRVGIFLFGILGLLTNQIFREQIGIAPSDEELREVTFVIRTVITVTFVHFLMRHPEKFKGV